MAQHDGTPLATVYVLFCRNKLYKIGYSRNVPQRQYQIDPEAVIKWTIQTQHPRRLEKALHQHFAEWHDHGEYFALEEADLRWIVRLGASIPDGRLPLSAENAAQKATGLSARG